VRCAFISSLILVPALVALAVWLCRPAGSVQAAGITVAFAAVQDVVSTRRLITARSLIADNLGNAPGSVADSSSDTIIDSLKNAVGNYCVVADLKEGEEWWETRLLVLASGAARLAFPKAVVFTTAAPWPTELLPWLVQVAVAGCLWMSL
jgi:hypothetical protein